jgi:hypothetical protein
MGRGGNRKDGEASAGGVQLLPIQLLCVDEEEEKDW